MIMEMLMPATSNSHLIMHHQQIEVLKGKISLMHSQVCNIHHIPTLRHAFWLSSMMADSSDNKRDLMMELYNFVKDGNLETGLLMKEKKLSVLSSHLSSLNKVFATYNSNEILDSARREAVEFLRDFCFRIPALKLVHGQNSPQGAINVSRLQSLTHLEIGKAPVHMLVGLRALRQQLQVLICTRCLHSIEILIGKCGGDRADEEDWPHLHTLNLSFNYLTSLDSSLQFLPSLRVLDLSHNQIKTSSQFLECFSELQHLNMSYNSLSRVPSLSPLSQRKLKTLNLRNNNLEYMEDIHLFENLESLELSRNCIYSDQQLLSLNSVQQITKINMQGNPVAQEPLYRQLVTKNLPPGAAFRTVYLDGRPLSEAEIKFIPTQRKTVYQSPPKAASSAAKSSLFVEQSVDSFEGSADYSSPGLTRPLRGKDKKKKKKKKDRVRHVVISDQAQNEDLPAVTPKSLDNSFIEEAKKEFEKKREEHGQDWLLSLQAPYRKPPEAINGGDNLNPFLQVDWDGGETSQEPQREKTEDVVKDIPGEEEEKAKDGGPKETEVITVDIEPRKEETSEDAFIEEREGGLPPETQSTSQKEAEKEADVSLTELNDTQTSSGIDLEYDFQTNGLVITTQELIQESDLEKSDLQRTDSEEDLCGPLLVKLSIGTDGEFNEILLTVKQTHLEESDLNGEVQERLELVSLLSVDVSEEHLKDEGVVPVVEINFEYVRKDRRQRRYFMEDQSSSEMLSAVLEHFWQENQQKKVTQFMSCLKCAKEFPLSKAIMVLDKPKGRKTSDQQEYSLNEIPTCPFCGNRYLVEKEHGSVNSGTPVIGSFSSTGTTKPLAASSPWKARENGQLSSSLGRQFSISPKVPPPTAVSPSESLATVVNPGSSSTLSDKPNSSFSSEVLDVSLRLPESTIPSDSMDTKTPIEEVAHYSREQLDMLLKSDEYQFRDRYSLMPQVSMDASSVQGTPRRTSGNVEEQAVVGMVKDERRPVQVQEEDIYGGRSEFSDEDDIDILEDSHESAAEVQQSTGKEKVNTSSRIISLEHGRNHSNESDIAVLSDREQQETEARSRVDSITSDNVFGNTDVIDGGSTRGCKSSLERSDEGSGFLSSYERKTTDSSLTGSGSISDRDSKRDRKVSMLARVKVDQESADHRLKLFYSMSLFSSDDEHFQCHVVGIICAPSMLGPVNYEGLVVLSNTHIYVLKVGKSESEKPSDFLTKKLTFPILELLYLHVGVGSQLVQFEFAADGGRFTLMTGDGITVEKFATLVRGSVILKENQSKKFEGVKRDHMDVKESLLALMSEDDENATGLDQITYIHALDTKQKDASTSYMRQGIFITEHHIYLLVQNCSWPLVGLKSSKVTTRGQHFFLKEQLNITDITDLECAMQELKVVINFSDEDEDREGHWEVKFLTPSSVKQMVDAINRPWSEQFGVDLTVSFVDLS